MPCHPTSRRRVESLSFQYSIGDAILERQTEVLSVGSTTFNTPLEMPGPQLPVSFTAEIRDFQYSIGDATRVKVYGNYYMRVEHSFNTPLEMRGRGMVNMRRLLWLMSFNTPLEMHESRDTGIRSARVALSILHWRCVTRYFTALPSISSIIFQYSIGDALLSPLRNR